MEPFRNNIIDSTPPAAFEHKNNASPGKNLPSRHSFTRTNSDVGTVHKLIMPLPPKPPESDKKALPNLIFDFSQPHRVDEKLVTIKQELLQESNNNNRDLARQDAKKVFIKLFPGLQKKPEDFSAFKNALEVIEKALITNESEKPWSTCLENLFDLEKNDSTGILKKNRELRTKFDALTQTCLKELVSALVFTQAEYFSEITANELFCKFAYNSSNETLPSLNNFLIFENNFILCAFKKLLNPFSTAEERALRIQTFVLPIAKVFKKGDFCTSFTLINVLTHPTINELPETMRLVPQEIKEMIKTLDKKMPPDKNYFNFRKLMLTNKNAFTIPHLRTFLTDLTMLYEQANASRTKLKKSLYSRECLLLLQQAIENENKIVNKKKGENKKELENEKKDECNVEMRLFNERRDLLKEVIKYGRELEELQAEIKKENIFTNQDLDFVSNKNEIVKNLENAKARQKTNDEQIKRLLKSETWIADLLEEHALSSSPLEKLNKLITFIKKTEPELEKINQKLEKKIKVRLEAYNVSIDGINETMTTILDWIQLAKEYVNKNQETKKNIGEINILKNLHKTEGEMNSEDPLEGAWALSRILKQAEAKQDAILQNEKMNSETCLETTLHN